MILGIDPGLRHTGLCLLDDGHDPVFTELQPYPRDVLAAVVDLKLHLKATFLQLPHNTVIAMEKQLSVGGQSSSLLFYVQMAIAETIWEWAAHGSILYKMVMPLPVQLNSYMKKVHGVSTENATAVVRSFKKATGYGGRISVHCVDAYYLAKMGQDVVNGKWSFPLPSKEMPLFPWSVTHG